MITYLVTRDGAHAVRELPGFTLGPAASHLEILTYEQALLRREWQVGTVIFSDLERFWNAQFRLVTQLYHRLAAAPRPVHLINSPMRTLARYGLLRRLREQGLNSFDVYRADEQRKPARFPVFLRNERDHRGPLTDLLRGQAALDRMLNHLTEAGGPLSLLLVTEFSNVRSPDGLYRKYGAYIVGDRIIPRHLYFSNHWNVKDFRTRIPPRFQESNLFAEELDYLHGNPHEAALRQIFKLAGIQYGRIDYSLRADGGIETWEINTNPVHMVAAVPPGTPRYDEIFVPFNDRLHEALMALPGATSTERFSIEPVRKSRASGASEAA
jgi:hypothetical protein